ncbi:OLC1v1019114C1 [Oldenlandia corymbosa var. corymbosa]|uniref:OLC1v1019114C1 n=1 Tax=Oldenlandia corymbosa var. corymbosa TaxID=529605 RepID=A0AAV1ED62_OLDCO|nr:OLC1v1019114C1 [Oldenlandia corymbosa var. corymbosa]
MKQQRVELGNDEFRCPYCKNRRRQIYSYREILQHATSIAATASTRRTLEETAYHEPLAQFLEQDLCPTLDNKVSNLHLHRSQLIPLTIIHFTNSFSAPTGIIINLLTFVDADGSRNGIANKALRDELAAKSMFPTKVQTLWNTTGNLGSAIIHLSNDKVGFGQALAFEKLYKDNNHAKHDWLNDMPRKEGAHGWIAQEDDFNNRGPLTEKRHKHCQLLSLSHIIELDN